MADVWSETTKTAVERPIVNEVDDLYPDRSATPDSSTATPMAHEYSIRSTTATVGRLDAPTTTKDMSRLFTWEHGDPIYGTFANQNIGMNEFIDDIEAEYGREDDYKPYFIDTTSEEGIGPQLAERGKR